MTAKPTDIPTPSMFIGYNELLGCLEAWRAEATPEIAPEWQTPADLSRGILTSNLAFRIAKAERKHPAALAGEMILSLSAYASKCSLPVVFEAVGPYLNVQLTGAFYSSLLTADLTSNLAIPRPEKVMLEYIGANVAKRLHAGHMRNLNIGDSLRRILSVSYPNLITDNHWGDWGVQFGVLLWAYKQNINLEAYKKRPIDELQRLYVWGTAQETVVPDWANAVRAEFVKLEQGNLESRALWQEIVTLSKTELAHDLALFDVPPTDLEQGESFYEIDMKDLQVFMDENHLWHMEGDTRYVDYEELAAKWEGIDSQLAVRVAGFGRCYLISSNGYTTYAFRDVAARLQWARDLKIERAITVTDYKQGHNFDQAFSLICYLATLPAFAARFGADTATRLQWNKLVHVGYGFLQLESGKMSTRLGTGLRLPELVEEVSAAAREALASRTPDLPAATLDTRAHAIALSSLKWADLNRDPSTDVTLDPAVITRFEGNTGTYQLYTYARLRSVLRKASPDSEVMTSDLGTYLTSDQRYMLALMYILPSVITTATNDYRPNVIAAHVYMLAENANRWYVTSPKLLEMTSSDGRRAASLALIEQVTAHQAYCLGLLGITTIEEL